MANYTPIDVRPKTLLDYYDINKQGELQRQQMAEQFKIQEYLRARQEEAQKQEMFNQAIAGFAPQIPNVPTMPVAPQPTTTQLSMAPGTDLSKYFPNQQALQDYLSGTYSNVPMPGQPGVTTIGAPPQAPQPNIPKTEVTPERQLDYENKQKQYESELASNKSLSQKANGAFNYLKWAFSTGKEDLIQGAVDRIQNSDVAKYFPNLPQMGKVDLTSEMKNFEAENPQLRSQRGTSEYGTQFTNWRNKAFQEKQGIKEKDASIMRLMGFDPSKPGEYERWNNYVTTDKKGAAKYKEILNKTGDIDTTTPSNIPQRPLGQVNPEALQGLSSGDQELVKKLVNYEVNMPSSFAMSKPYWQNIIKRAVLYDPSFDVTQFKQKQQLKVDFASGKSAQNIKSLNTAVSHLQTLKQKADALKNSDITLWNAIRNKGLSATGDPRVVGFNTAATAVESELAAVFKGMGATDQEIKAWRENLNSSQSPEQLKESINTAIELISGRLQALQNQYEVGMGRPKDFHFLSDKSRQILQGLGVDVDKIDSGKSTQEKTSGGVTALPAGI